MVFLDAVGLLGGCFDNDVGEVSFCNLSARRAGECDGRKAQCVRHVEGIDDVFGVSRGRDAEQYVAGFAEA